MLRVFESFDECARRCFREMRAAAARDKRERPKHAETIGGVRYCFTGRKSPESPDPDDTDDLPRELKKARPSLRHTFRAISALTDANDDRADKLPVWTAEIVRWLDEQNIDPPNAISTTDHALRDLRSLHLAYSLPDSGWRLGDGRLPTENRQSPSTEIVAYCSDMANAGVRRFGGFAMKRTIWVPGERDEYTGAVVVTDAETGRVYPGGDKTGEMSVPTRSGRLCTVPAAKGELVGAEGKYLLVRVAGATVRTRNLGDWQLRGLTAPEMETEPTPST